MRDTRPADHLTRRPTPRSPAPLAQPSAAAGPPAHARAFTLVELLVALGVIAVLIGILTPALRGALGAARDAVCLSNQKQIALAWIVYGNEHGRFPSGDPKHVDEVNVDGEVIGQSLIQESVELTRDWGGVNWFTDENRLPLDDDRRKINPYIGSEENETALAEVFLCPRDDGLRMNVFQYGYYGIDALQYNFGGGGFTGSSALDLISKSRAEDAGWTTYSVYGTSYRANDWIWSEIGHMFGYRHQGRMDDLYSHATERNQQVDAVDPSRFVITGDWGSMIMGRIPAERWERSSEVFGWWHGAEFDNIAFLDGSARRTRYEPGRAATGDYSFYFDPERHKPWSWVIAWSNSGAPRFPTSDNGQ